MRPSCSLHSANRNAIGALRWAVVDRGCTVVSQSFHRSTEPGSADLQSGDIYKDWFAIRTRTPRSMRAAGNHWATDPDGIMPPESEFVNHKTYNGLVVANHDDAAGAMSGDSVFGKPDDARADRGLTTMSHGVSDHAAPMTSGSARSPVSSASRARSETSTREPESCAS